MAIRTAGEPQDLVSMDQRKTASQLGVELAVAEPEGIDTADLETLYAVARADGVAELYLDILAAVIMRRDVYAVSSERW